jgi:hypothetical protein
MILLPKLRAPSHARSQRKQRGFAWLTNPYRYGAGPIICDAAHFDGTNDILKRGGALSGISDSGSGILSLWIKFDLASYQVVSAGERDTYAKFFSAKDTPGVMLFIVTREADTTAIVTHNSASAKSLGVWYHELRSWDRSASVSQLYVNDVSEGTPTFGGSAGDVCPYSTMVDWQIGAHFDDSLKTDGGVAEYYFAPGQTLDFSIESNRRKFLNSAGKPVFLGTDGSLPTGTVPRIYLHLDDGEAASNFATNRGSGGNFAVTGSLTTYGSSPSD